MGRGGSVVVRKVVISAVFEPCPEKKRKTYLHV